MMCVVCTSRWRTLAYRAFTSELNADAGKVQQRRVHTQGRVPQGDAQQRRVRESVAHVLLDPDQLLRQGLGVGRVAALLAAEGASLVGVRPHADEKHWSGHGPLRQELATNE